MATAAFDPSQPFTVDGEEEGLQFDPSQPFEVVDEGSRVGEFATRAVKGVQTGLQDVTGGFRQVVADAFRSRQNPFLETSAQQATEEIPKLQQEIATKQSEFDKLYPKNQGFMGLVKQANQDPIGSTNRQLELTNLQERLTQAREASQGRVSEPALGTLSRASQDLATASQEKKKEIEKGYEGKVSPYRDEEFWMQVADSLGQSIPSTGAAVLNTPLGLSLMYAQTYGGARDEYVRAQQDKGLPVDQEKAAQYALDQANIQTPFEVVGDVAIAKTIGRSLANILESNPAPKAVSQWLKERGMDLLKSAAGETLITTPGQSIFEDIIAENAGVREPTTTGQKIGKAVEQAKVAAAQSLLMGGGPVAAEGGVQAARRALSPRNQVIVEQAAEQAENLEANNAPATAKAVEDIAINEVASSRIEEALDELTAGEDIFTPVDETRFAPPNAETPTQQDQPQAQPPQPQEGPAGESLPTDETTGEIVQAEAIELTPEAARVRVEEALATGQTPDPADVELAGASIQSAQPEVIVQPQTPTPNAQQITSPEAPNDGVQQSQIPQEDVQLPAIESGEGVSQGRQAEVTAPDFQSRVESTILPKSEQKQIQIHSRRGGKEVTLNEKIPVYGNFGIWKDGKEFKIIHVPSGLKMEGGLSSRRKAEQAIKAVIAAGADLSQQFPPQEELFKAKDALIFSNTGEVPQRLKSSLRLQSNIPPTQSPSQITNEETTPSRPNPTGEADSGTSGNQGGDVRSGDVLPPSPAGPDPQESGGQRAEPRRIQLKGNPNVFTIVEALPQSAQERELGESYFVVRSERDGTEQTIESRDIAREVRPKSAKVKAAIKNLPSEQQAKAEVATDIDTSPDPYRGAPLSSGNPLSLEQGSALLSRLSQFGFLDEGATAKTLLQGVLANNPDPWEKRLAERLLELNPKSTPDVRYRPESTWSGVKAQGRIIFNLARNPVPISHFILHEIAHEVTLDKLRNPQSLKGIEREAYDGLTQIWEEIRNLPEFQTSIDEGKPEYGISSVEEMVAEAFGNASFRSKLQQLNPDQPPSSLWRRLVRWIAQLIFKRKVQPTSTLEKVIENAFILAGAPISESQSNGTAAMAAPSGWRDIFNLENTSQEAEAKALIEASQELETEVETEKKIEPLTDAQRGYIESLTPNPIGILKYWANQFHNIPGTDFNDRVGIATDGLVAAAKSYDPEKGPFISHANQVIRQKMLDYQRTVQMKKRDARRTVSGSLPVIEGESETLIDIAPSPEDLTIQENELQQLRSKAGDAILGAMSRLTERDRNILKDYASGMNLRDVGARNGVSPEGANKIIKRSRDLMLRALQARGINSVQEILDNPQPRNEPIPTRQISPEDEQAFSESTIGQLERESSPEVEPDTIPEGEQADEAIFAAEGGNPEAQVETDAIRAMSGWVAADNERATAQERRDLEVFHQNARTSSLSNADAQRAVRMRLDSVGFNSFQKELQKLFNKRIVFVGGLPEGSPSGLFIPSNSGVIYLNSEGNYPLMFLTGHEFGHDLKRNNRGLYEQLQKFVLENASDWTDYRNYLINEKKYSPDKAEEEFVDDFIGANFNDGKFWRKLWQKDKPLFERLVQAAMDFLNELTGKVSAMTRDVRPYFRNWEEMQDRLVSLVEQYQTQEVIPQISQTVSPEEITPSDTSSVAPIAPRGRQTRTPIFRTSEGPYKPEGVFRAAGKWNAAIYNLLKGKEQSTRAALNRAQFVANQFDRELKKTFTDNGIPVPTELLNTALGNTDNRLTPEQADAANQIRDEEERQSFILTAKLYNLEQFKLRQEAALQSLPENLRSSIMEMRELIDNLSRKLIKEGDISDDLKVAVDQNAGTYLHRSYQIFDGDEWADFILSDDPEARAIRNRAESLFASYIRAGKAAEYGREMREAGTPVSRADALSAVQDLDVSKEAETMLADYLSIADGTVVDTFRGKLPGQKNQSILKLRGDIPLEIRELWGQYNDPTINFAKTYASMATFLENNKFLKGVLEDGLSNGYLWKEGVSDTGRPANWVEIVGSEGAKSMAPLAGTYGPPLLRDAFNEAFNPRVQDWLGTLTTAAMKAKTVYSIGSIVRNFFGNPAFMIANGNFFGGLGNAGTQAIANFRKLGTTEQRERIARYTELGVLGDNVGPSIIKELSERSRRISDAGGPLKESLRWLGEKSKGVRDAFEGAYSGVDDFWKIYAFESELAKLKWANPEANVSDLEQRAAGIVRNTVPTYSESSAIVRDLLKNKFGKFIAPFITFTTEVMRTTLGSFKQTYSELSSANPRERALGAERLAGQLTIAILPFIFMAASKAIFGYDDDEEAALRAGLPDWQKNATLLFLPRDSKGNVRYVDLSYLNPYNYFHDAFTGAWRAHQQGGSSDQIAAQAGLGAAKQLLDPFLAEQIAIGAYVDIARNQKANGAEVYNPQDDIATKATKIAQRIAQSFTPGTLDSAGRIYKAGIGFIEPTGRAYDLGNEIMAPLLGQRISSYNPQQGLQFQTSRFNADRNDAAQIFGRVFTSQGTVNPGQVAQAYERSNEARYRIYHDLREDYLGALALGLTRQQAIETMKSKRAGEEAISQAVNGTYLKYTPTESTLNQVRRDFPERFQEFMEAYRSTPTQRPFPR